MKQGYAEILDNFTMAPGYHKMTLGCETPFGAAQPGQFVMLTVGAGAKPLLRRPFSIHRMVPDASGRVKLEILYKVVGEGTGIMARMPVGATVDILGPLGRGFIVRGHYRRIYIAAGGIGAAPMVFLLETLRQQLESCQYHVFLGGRSRGDLLCRERFDQLADQVDCTTDDGSEGAQCFLTSPLEAAVRRQPPDVIMACGPMDMLTCVAGIADRLNVACQLSIESVMACGMGACLGCAVPAAGDGSAYHHVCKDGPVFDAQLLKL
ncbi:MAG: dihydroorotate dehydrogenase electron transfer subunit [Deltaproteobacteria bacterium]|jgi:dihydroorotate dehydrogenase electron transfer subunit|nr:dihydroorotate dehydrogenase electron transfer subunit [Deltaproteobacteria bacterium]